ncbi:hypothetical protein [Ornithinimicrobium sp. F0845]|uniref:hypothetical protein n=1 Tax=Ornithinimicrobium sp. F0845 TaxID=2926412 RepID=UPI00248CC802|nr:hypothetical protein [Ornithinimicrobium sp. F0845]
MSAWLPRVTAAAGCGGSGRELARFGDLAALDAVLIGPIGPPGADDAGGAGRARARLAASPSGLVHTPAPALPVEHVVEDLLPWFRARGLPVVCAVRGGTAGAVADVLQELRRSLDFTTVAAVEVDLTTDREETRAAGVLGPTDRVGPWSADPQACLKLLASAREQLPRDLLLTAKLAGECPDPLATSRAAVGGGARALVLSGSVPAVGPPRQHLVGPAIGPVTLGLVTRIRAAIAAGRVPDVPLVAVGGVHDIRTARQARATGAAGVQLGTALLADPQVLWDVHQALTTVSPPPPVSDTTD